MWHVVTGRINGADEDTALVLDIEAGQDPAAVFRAAMRDLNAGPDELARAADQECHACGGEGNEDDPCRPCGRGRDRAMDHLVRPKIYVNAIISCPGDQPVVVQ